MVYLMLTENLAHLISYFLNIGKNCTIIMNAECYIVYRAFRNHSLKTLYKTITFKDCKVGTEIQRCYPVC